MKTEAMQTNRALMSLNDHGTPDFPVQFFTDEFRNIRLGHVKWHWHRQLELSLVVQGEVCYSVGEEQVLLKTGEGVFVNTNTLHMAKPAGGDDTVMFSVLFDAGFLSPGAHSIIHQKYVLPVLDNRELPFVKLTNTQAWQVDALGLLTDLRCFYHEKPYGFELKTQSILCQIWRIFIENGVPERSVRPVITTGLGQQRIKKMISFIQQHFYEPLSLRQIAAAASVSKNECGFENASYFTKVFRSRTGFTPTQYR